MEALQVNDLVSQMARLCSEQAGVEEFLGRVGSFLKGALGADDVIIRNTAKKGERASTAEEWVFKRDHSVRVPWDRALHQIDGVTYLRPELALLFKAGQDREDLAAARLTAEGRQWLAATLERLGHTTWAELTRHSQ